MNCKKATQSYEAWLAKRIRIVKPDLALKHQEMAADIFSFMRATFYRWVELWTKLGGEIAKSPVVLAVGDLHVENFGTWRDQEGRLVWGINDFDEAFPLPYTNDLVRLAVSAHMAISSNHLAIRPDDACKAILDGYSEGLEKGGAPFVLAEKHQWLRSTVTSELRDPFKFWAKLLALATIKSPLSTKAKKAFGVALPDKDLKYRVVNRVAGLGSLGRERVVALAEWHGGMIAREAKAVAPSACVWASGRKDGQPLYEKIVRQSIRCPDPFLKLSRGWVLRRLAPDCSRVELAMLPKDHDEYKLLMAMGRETANVHLGTTGAIAKVKRDLAERHADWLHSAAKRMAQATDEDWQGWRSAEKNQEKG